MKNVKNSLKLLLLQPIVRNLMIGFVTLCFLLAAFVGALPALDDDVEGDSFGGMICSIFPQMMFYYFVCAIMGLTNTRFMRSVRGTKTMRTTIITIFLNGGAMALTAIELITASILSSMGLPALAGSDILIPNAVFAFVATTVFAMFISVLYVFLAWQAPIIMLFNIAIRQFDTSDFNGTGLPLWLGAVIAVAIFTLSILVTQRLLVFRYNRSAVGALFSRATIQSNS